MNKRRPYITSIRIKNFKAIRDSGVIKLTPLTMLIGNNGSGKSSLIEALETFQIMGVQNLQTAMRRWNGIEHITNSYSKNSETNTPTIDFALRGRSLPSFKGDTKVATNYTANVQICASRDLSDLKYLHDCLTIAATRNVKEQVTDRDRIPDSTIDDRSYGASVARITNWQFLALNPESMGQPKPSTYGERNVLYPDGSNIAGFLKQIYENNKSAFEDLIDVMRFVVPYARDIQIVQTSEIRTNYLSLVEDKFKIPGWLISSGTLRVLAILACLRHPNPPSLLVIDELENGLDPRTLGLVVSEIQSAVESGRTQVIATTHSPTLLNQIPLDYIIGVRRENGSPKFIRYKHEDFDKWLEDFNPGDLYLKGVLDR